MGQKKEYDLRCSFCGRHQTQVYRLIASTPQLCVCNQCIEDAWLLLYGKRDNLSADLEFAVADSTVNPKLCCSFCHRSSEKVGRMVSTTAKAHICEECVEACRNLLIEEEEKKK